MAPGGVIYDDGSWRLEHILEPIPMVGWLVLKPLRHVETIAGLTMDEATAFGQLSKHIVEAMEMALDPAKVYLCMFAEAENFAHIHFHFIPRFEDTPTERRGPKSFDYLRDASVQGRNMGDIMELDRVVSAIRERLRTTGS